MVFHSSCFRFDKEGKTDFDWGHCGAGSAFDSTGSCDRRRYFDVAEVRIPVFRCLEQFGQSISFRRDVLFVILCAAFLYMGNHPAQRAEIASFPSYGLNKNAPAELKNQSQERFPIIRHIPIRAG